MGMLEVRRYGRFSINAQSCKVEIGFGDRISLQTYQKLAMWRPKFYMDLIKTPSMIIIPELG
jgi:hypothetical protein